MGVERERFAFQLLSQSSENNWDIHWSPTQGNLPLEPQYVSLVKHWPYMSTWKNCASSLGLPVGLELNF